jgi:hypothetical protein
MMRNEKSELKSIKNEIVGSMKLERKNCVLSISLTIFKNFKLTLTTVNLL